MKLQLVIVGTPKLAYAKLGFEEYLKRLGRFHQVRVTSIADKYAYSSAAFAKVIEGTFQVVLEITGQLYSSQQLSDLLEKRSQMGQEISFIIGGPEGLPLDIINNAHLKLSLSRLTLPHDLAMLVLAETLYRSSTISAGHPYHK